MPVYEEKGLVNGQKRWFIRTYITDEYGNRKQVTRHNKEWIGREGKKSAEWEEKRLQNSKYNEYEKLTMDQLFFSYEEYIKKNLKPSSIRKTTDNYLLHIKPFFGIKQINNLTTKDILDFHDYLDKKTIEIKTDNQKRSKGIHYLSITFKQSIHVTLVSLLNFGCKYFNLEKNVASIVGNYKKPKGSNIKKLCFLTVDEFNRFIEFEKNEIYKDFYTVLFYTGMRRGELVALKYDNINFQKKEINIKYSINLKNGNNETVPKTDKSNRTIKMLDIVYNTLLKYNHCKDDFIFGIDNIKATTLQRKCDKNCKLANINKNIRIHDFRHSFASMCIDKGVPIEVISNYLGHESISTTLDTYGHLYPNSQNKLIQILNDFLQKQDQN